MFDFYKQQISTTEGQTFAQEIGAIFSETSALTATNVEWLFVEIGQHTHHVMW